MSDYRIPTDDYPRRRAAISRVFIRDLLTMVLAAVVLGGIILMGRAD